jgi:hypothetical protein
MGKNTKPTNGRNGESTNLYLDGQIKSQANRLAFELGISLSDLVEAELVKLIARRANRAAKRGIAA